MVVFSCNLSVYWRRYEGSKYFERHRFLSGPHVCFQCDTQEVITQQPGRVLPRYLTCLKARSTGFHMLYHLCRWSWWMLRKVVAKFRVRNPVHLPSLKIQMLGKILKLQNFTWKFVYKKACLSVFHTHQSACELSFGLLSYCSSKIAISRVKRVVTLKGWTGLDPRLPSSWKKCTL